MTSLVDDSVTIVKIPTHGQPTLVSLSGERACKPLTDNGEMLVLSGLFEVMEIIGLWRTKPRNGTFVSYSMVFDEEGRLKKLTPNETLPGMLGHGYVYKEEVSNKDDDRKPLSIEEEDLPLIRERLRIVAATTFCPSMDAFRGLCRRYGRFPGVYILMYQAMDSSEFATKDGKTRYFKGTTVEERLESYRSFVEWVGPRLDTICRARDGCGYPVWLDGLPVYCPVPRTNFDAETLVLLGKQLEKTAWIKKKALSDDAHDKIAAMLKDWITYEQGWVFRANGECKRLFHYLCQIGVDQERPEALDLLNL